MERAVEDHKYKGKDHSRAVCPTLLGVYSFIVKHNIASVFIVAF